MATRGQPADMAAVAPYLVSFGLAKAADLHSKESLALWGFQGGAPPPPWVSLRTGQGDDFLGLQERYLPLGSEAYGCTLPTTASRKDLELLKKATGLQ